MARKLNVYRTPIGFHDAYVAATSQKAALAAWGSDADLFARGMAERVTDEALGREALDHPGTVIRRARGTTDEHMAALPKDAPARKTKTTPRAKAPESAPKAKPQPKSKPKPRPSRADLDAAERALADARTEHEETIADLRRQEKELQQRRRDLEQRHETAVAKLEAALTAAQKDYGTALEAWRA